LGATSWPRERWSPDGAYVLFKTQGFRGDLKLLDVATGATRVIAPRDYNIEGISWKSDSSEVVCVGSKRGSPARAFVINPRTLEKQDFSAEFNTFFGSDSGDYSPNIAPIWTPGDQYFIVNGGRKGGCLVNPRPWKVIPVARLLIHELDREGPLVSAEQATVRLPWISWQPARGWVKVGVQIPDKGYLRRKEYLVDYSGRVFVPLDESPAPTSEWTITPGGKQAVGLANSGRLIVRGISLPSLDAQ